MKLLPILLLLSLSASAQDTTTVFVLKKVNDSTWAYAKPPKERDGIRCLAIHYATIGDTSFIGECNMAGIYYMQIIKIGAFETQLWKNTHYFQWAGYPVTDTFSIPPPIYDTVKVRLLISCPVRKDEGVYLVGFLKDAERCYIVEVFAVYKFSYWKGREFIGYLNKQKRPMKINRIIMTLP